MIFESQGLSLSRAALKCRAQLRHSAGDSARKCPEKEFGFSCIFLLVTDYPGAISILPCLKIKSLSQLF